MTLDLQSIFQRSVCTGHRNGIARRLYINPDGYVEHKLNGPFSASLAFSRHSQDFFTKKRRTGATQPTSTAAHVNSSQRCGCRTCAGHNRQSWTAGHGQLVAQTPRSRRAVACADGSEGAIADGCASPSRATARRWRTPRSARHPSLRHTARVTFPRGTRGAREGGGAMGGG